MLVEGVVRSRVGVEVLLALRWAVVVAGGICPWIVVVVVGVIVRHDCAGVLTSQLGMIGLVFKGLNAPGVTRGIGRRQFSSFSESVCLLVSYRGEVVDSSSCLRHTTSSNRGWRSQSPHYYCLLSSALGSGIC